MQTKAARTHPNGELLAQLASGGGRLPEPVARAIRELGRGAVHDLVEILEDEGLAQRVAPGGGYAPIHAAALLRDLGAREAIEPMFRALARCDPLDRLYSALVDALKSLGPPVLEPALAAHAAARSKGQRMAVAEVLSGIGVVDDRILAVLLRLLEEQVDFGAGLLAEYGDPSALPHLGAALDACELDPRGGLFANHEVVELDTAIRDLGGSLTRDQGRKVRALEAARDAARAPLSAIGAADDDLAEDDVGDDDVGDDPEREEVVRRFCESSHAGADCDPFWVDLSFTYADEYLGVAISDFDARALREVVFELFPRKVSCEPAVAPEVIGTLRAFWTFARDALGHAHAQACLGELGDEAIPTLARRLADTSNYGLAKAFVMMGRGLRVDSGEGLSGQRAPQALHVKKDDEGKRKKRLRKLKKQSQRRNRR
jgi:hypothetical protein